MTELPFRKIAVLGTGLVGGSFALAARKLGATVTGFDRPEILQEASRCGAIDHAASDVATAVAEMDLVVIAVPLGAAIDLLSVVAKHAAPGALVTDVCSTKARICEAAQKLFTSGARFLGGHPMAGKEAGGTANASAELFRNAKYALIARENDDDPRIAKFAGLIRAFVAEPVWLDAETHDWAASIVSHLPQLAAIALAGVVQDETDETGLPLSLAGPGLRDLLRLAGSPYDIWRDICHSNPENIRHALDRLITALDHVRNHLTSRELAAEFAAANDLYKNLRGMK